MKKNIDKHLEEEQLLMALVDKRDLPLEFRQHPANPGGPRPDAEAKRAIRKRH